MRNNILIALLLITNVSILIFVFKDSNSSKIFVFDYEKVFNDFKLKKELEVDLKKYEQTQKNLLDSTRVELEFLIIEAKQKNDLADIQKIRVLEDAYKLKEYEFKKNTQTMANNFNSQIKNKLDELIDEFRKERKISLIIGKSNSVDFILNDDQIDKTNDIIIYINEKYEVN